MRCFYTLISRNVVFHPMTFGVKFLLLLSYIAGESFPSLFCSFINHLFFLLFSDPHHGPDIAFGRGQQGAHSLMGHADLFKLGRAEDILETWLLEADSGPTPGVSLTQPEILFVPGRCGEPECCLGNQKVIENMGSSVGFREGTEEDGVTRMYPESCFPLIEKSLYPSSGHNLHWIPL